MFINSNKISKGIKRISCRNNLGHITGWRRGGGHKKRYRFVDFFRTPISRFFTVVGFEYDPVRSSFLTVLSSIFNKKIVFSRILFVKGVKLFQQIRNHKKQTQVFNYGDSYYIIDIPTGSFVHNIEKIYGTGGKFVRAAGCFAQIVQKTKDSVFVKLPSGKIKSFSNTSRCTFGVLGNETHNQVIIGKAGRSRWLGKKPTVRGVSINPIDHPHGGGEGKGYVGRHPVSPWGKLTKS